MAGFDVLLNHAFNHSPLLNRRRPQARQIGDVTLCRATAHPGQQNVLVGHSVSSGAFEGLAVAGEAMPASNGLTQLSSDHAADSLFKAWLRPDCTSNVVGPSFGSLQCFDHARPLHCPAT